jgi:hypothetical protein
MLAKPRTFNAFIGVWICLETISIDLGAALTAYTVFALFHAA